MTHDQAASAELDQELRRRGAIILSVFAFVWAVGVPGFASLSVQLIALVVALALTVTTVMLAVRDGSTKIMTRRRQLPSDWRRRYNLVGLAQAVAIVIAIVALVSLESPEFIPPAICLIVGVHFFPLARIFDQGQYVRTGVALCALAVLGVASLAVVSAEASRIVVGVGAAITLWATAIDLTWRR